YMRAEVARLAESGARLTVIGRRDRLPGGLAAEIAGAEQATAGGERLHLRIALDYSSRDAIVRAASRLIGTGVFSLDRFGRLIAQAAAEEPGASDVALLIRSGGEQRLSDFLLWESAYAELWFTERMWPDFTAADLAAAIAAFRRRDRRFGGLGNVTPLRPDKE